MLMLSMLMLRARLDLAANTPRSVQCVMIGGCSRAKVEAEASSVLDESRSLPRMPDAGHRSVRDLQQARAGEAPSFSVPNRSPVTAPAPVLRDARRLADGRWTGTLGMGDRTQEVWLNVVAERRVPMGDSSQLRYLEVVGGRIYELEPRFEECDVVQSDDFVGDALFTASAAFALWARMALVDLVLTLRQSMLAACGDGAKARWAGALEDLYVAVLAATGLLLGSQLLILAHAAPIGQMTVL